MTRLVLNSGHEVEVKLPIDELADRLEQALDTGSLLELTAPDGRKLLINPLHVQIAQGITQEGAVTRRLSPARAGD